MVCHGRTATPLRRPRGRWSPAHRDRRAWPRSAGPRHARRRRRTPPPGVLSRCLSSKSVAGTGDRPTRSVKAAARPASVRSRGARPCARRRPRVERGIDVPTELAGQLLRAVDVLVEQAREHADLHPQRDQPLLGAVVQVALDLAPRPALRLGDQERRLGDRLVLLESAAGAGRDRLEQRRLLQDRHVVDQRGTRTPAVSHDGADHPSGAGIRRVGVLTPGGVDPASLVGQPVEDVQARVVQGVGDDRTQLGRVGAALQAGHQSLQPGGDVEPSSMRPSAIESGIAQNRATRTRPGGAAPAIRTKVAIADVRARWTRPSAVPGCAAPGEWLEPGGPSGSLRPPRAPAR